MSKLDGIKAGDRVRVTFEGVVTEDEYAAIAVAMDGAQGYQAKSWWANKHEVNASTFKITRTEPAFKLGDEVRTNGDVRHMEVVAILKDGRVVVEYQAGDSTNVMARDASCFTHD